MRDIVLSQIGIEELTEQISNRILFLINKESKLNYNSEKTESKEILTREETAKLCNVKSLTTLWNWEREGKLIPTMRAGKKPLYKRQDVIGFLNQKNK